MGKKTLLNLAILTMAAICHGQPDPFMTFRTYIHSGQDNGDTLKILQATFDSEKNPQIRAKEAFALGVIYHFKGDQNKAASFLGEAINLKTHLDDFAHFFIGEIERDNKDLGGAKLHFETVRNHQPPSSKEAEAEIEITKIDKAQGKWNDAFIVLSHLEKKHRFDPQYQEIVYNLIEASIQSHHSLQTCQAAIKVYGKLAPFSLTKGFGYDLSKVQIAGQNLKCKVLPKDRDKRLEQLIIAGELEEVHKEIKEWQTASPDDPQSEVQLGQLSLIEGKIQDAIGHFNKAGEKLKNNFTLQMDLSKAYSQTDNYAQAVESYLNAYRLAPHTQKGLKLGLKALFQAAFLGYQVKDYDGASRNFDEVIRVGRGQIVLDAKWHLAWIDYLKGHYELAAKDFFELAKNKHFTAVDQEKLLYWRGMAELRSNHIPEAREIFLELAGRPRLGYYTGAAQARLSTLPAAPLPIPPPAVGPSKSDTHADSRKPASEESLSGQKEEQKLDEDSQDDEEISSADEGSELLQPSVTSLKSQSLVERFERARDLIDLGFDSWAIAELREIERRTTNKMYLQNLMAEYLKAGDYYRSAYIGDVVFQNEREKEDIQKEAQIWKFAFPQAFSHAVIASSKEYNIPASFVWSIMRGESGYRQDIHSTAGALGLMQLIPPTAKKIAKLTNMTGFQTPMLLDPSKNIQLGTKYLQRLFTLMNGNLALVAASYNAGPHRVEAWVKDFGDLDMDEIVEHIPYMETRNYVKKVLRNYFIYENLYYKQPNSLRFLAAKPGVRFDGPKRASEDWGDIKD